MAVLVAVLVLPALLHGGVPSRSRRVQAGVAKVRAALGAGPGRAERLPLAQARPQRRRRFS